jgi:hypothetical protein
VQVDSSNAPGIQTHWVVLYAKKDDDYLMLDPWPYQPDITREDLLMRRYARGNALRRAISHVILYDAYGSGGPVTTPSQPTTVPASTAFGCARVRDSVTWGLNIRSSVDTTTTANIIAMVAAGTQLDLLEADGESKIGAVNQWVRVREPGGKEGFAAAWYLERIAVATPAPVPEPAPPSTNEAPGTSSTSETAPEPTPSTPTPSPTPQPTSPAKDKLIVVVSAAVGTSGLRLRKTPSMGGALVKMLKPGTKLTVLETVKNARPKVGKPNKWIHVREPNGQRGYVAAEYVKLA